MKYTTSPLSCVSMVEGDDAKFKVVDNCKGTLLREYNFQLRNLYDQGSDQKLGSYSDIT